jgi:serine/threonine protein kinase
VTTDAPKKLGQYQLLSHLATGGMAEIYLGRHKGIHGFEKQVVVKRILPELIRRKEFVEMFFDEARIAARLKHPNIVEIYDLGQDGGDYFIAMEYLKGRTLREAVVESIKKGDPLPPTIAALVVAQVCEGLHYAHEFTDDSGAPLQIVHRDVSPNNIILLYSGGVKLVDFGVAKTKVQLHRTEAGVLRGKLSYMSPEQCLGKPVDARSDVFSAGVVLWELLAQRRLFRRNSEQNTIEAVLSAHIPLVEEYRRGVPPELDEITRRAMERSVDSRYQSAAQMARDLRRCLLKLDAAVSNHEIGEFVRVLFRGQTKRTHGKPEKVRTQEQKPGFLRNLDDGTSPAGAVTDVADRFVDLDEDEPYLTDIETEVEGLATSPSRPAPTGISWVRKRLVLTAAAAVAVLGLIALVIGVIAGEDTAGEETVAKADAEFLEDDLASLTKLVIRSRPRGCLVKVNGIKIPGVTPMKELAVEPGRSHVVVVNCIGHHREIRRVSGRAGETITLDFAPTPKR